jgi:predicted dehydrogenase
MRLGVVGSGKIVAECLPVLKSIESISCVALCAREESRERAEALARAQGIGAVYTDYGEFLKDADVDLVYLGIVNSQHYPYALEALEAGKGVICEKPFTSTYRELEELSLLARRKGLFLFEAIPTLYFPNFSYLGRQIGRLGEIKLVQCNYSQYSSRYDRYLVGEVLPAFDPEFSGGALYDINVYNVHFVTALFGRPEALSYAANKGPNGIDTSGALLMRYPGFSALCSGAKDSESPAYAVVQGSKGYVELLGAANSATAVRSRIGGELESVNLQAEVHRMSYEFEAISELFSRRDLARCYDSLDHSLEVMDVLTRARADAGIVFAADGARRL